MLSPLETLIHTHSNKHHGFVLLTFLCSLNFESFCYVGDCRYSALQIYRIVLRVCLIFYSKTGVKQKAWQDAFNLWIESHVHEEDEEKKSWHFNNMASHQQKLWTGVWIGQIWTEAQNLNFFWLGTPNNQASPSLRDQKQIFTLSFLTDMHMKVWIQSRDTLRGLKHMVRVWVKWMLQHDHKCKEAVFSRERKHSTPQCEQISSHLSPYSLHTGFMYSYRWRGTSY